MILLRNTHDVNGQASGSRLVVRKISWPVIEAQSVNEGIGEVFYLSLHQFDQYQLSTPLQIQVQALSSHTSLCHDH